MKRTYLLFIATLCIIATNAIADIDFYFNDKIKEEGLIKGQVIEASSGNPIYGAIISIVSETGGENYEFITNIYGNYSANVFEDTYSLIVNSNYYTSVEISGIAVENDAIVVQDFQLNEFPFPVTSVIAEETIDGEKVNISWNKPSSNPNPPSIYEDFNQGIPDWFVPDQPEEDWYLENNNLTFTASVDDSWRSAYCNISYSNVISEISQQVINGSSAGIYVGNGFIEPTAGSGSNAILLNWTINGSYWFMTLIDGDIEDFSGFFSSSAINQGLGEENIIKAEVNEGTVTFSINNTTIYSTNAVSDEGFIGVFKFGSDIGSEITFGYWNIIPTGKNKQVEEFRVYRQLCNETTPMEYLGATTDTIFQDNNWNATDWGVYKWAVEAKYGINNSEIEYSNCLDKDMQSKVDIAITTDSGATPDSCYILFTNTSEPELELFYEIYLDDSGFHSWDSFRKGVYDIYIHLDGFEEINLTDVLIESDETFNWELTDIDENCLSPFNLRVENFNSSNFVISLNWDIPNKTIKTQSHLKNCNTCKNDKYMMGYNVYRNNEKLNDELVDVNYYYDTLNQNFSEACYQVTSVYSNCGESEYSNDTCVVWNGVYNLKNTIIVHPNPALNFFIVDSPVNIRSIKIINSMGQVVEAVKAVEMNNYTINTSALSSGIYFVEVETAAGIEKVRIIIAE